MPVDVNIWVVDNQEDLQTIFDKHESGEYYVTSEDVASLLKEFNPDLTREEFKEFYNTRTLDNCLGK